MLGSTLNVFTDIERTVAGMLVPPGDERLIVCRLVANFPIQLRHGIVNKSIVHPEQHISIEIIIVLQAVGLRTVRIGTLVAINTERRNTKLHPRLDGMNGFTQLLNETAYIVTAPITDIAESSRMLSVERLIRNLLACYRIRIEIIINMESIDIISSYNISCNTASILSSLSQSRIEKHQVVILEAKFRLLLDDAFR